jgi:hypothetical protein
VVLQKGAPGDEREVFIPLDDRELAAGKGDGAALGAPDD